MSLPKSQGDESQGACFGRERPLDVLDELCAAALVPRGARASLLVGEPGIGKSRLLAELARRLTGRPAAATVWRAGGQPMVAATPFALFAELVRKNPGPAGAAAARSSLLALCDARLASPGLGGDDAELGQAWLAWVSASQGRPLVILLDDVHHADAASAALLSTALSSDQAVYLVAATRTDASSPFLTEWRTHHPKELVLPALPPSAAKELVVSRIGAGAAVIAIARLVARGVGNPLFLHELAFTYVLGLDRHVPPDATLDSLIQTRVARLPQGLRELLAVASLFGWRAPEAGVRALVNAKGLLPKALAASVDELVTLRLITLSPERDLVFEPIVHAAAVPCLSAPQRELGHRLAADWLERAGVRDAALLAEHHRRSAAPEPASELATVAAKRIPPREPADGKRAGSDSALAKVTATDLAKLAATSLAPIEEPAQLTEVARHHYDVAGEFARGGLGRIVAAKDRRLDRVVAVKELLRGGPEASQRFVREAMITARLQHPGIVPIYEAGRWPSGEPFYAMKMVTGQALDEAIREAPTFAARMRYLPNVIAVAEAVGYAHSHRIIHRDLKPANVIIGAYGETVVIDWGLAKDLRQTEETVERPLEPAPAVASLGASPASRTSHAATVAGAVMGTPAYMPPEQARGEPVDERSDVYALGALLYHVVAGQPPFRGPHALEDVIKGPPPAVESLEPLVPAPLAAIVRKAIASRPADRYPGAEAMAEDLKRFQTGQLVSVHAYSTFALLGRWMKRHRAAIAVALAALVMVAVLGVISVRRIIVERDRARTAQNVAETERRVADTQRGELRARTGQLLLSRARALVHSDPTAALAWLKELDPSPGPAWGAARQITSEALDRGVAHLSYQERMDYMGLAIAPDGQHVAMGSRDSTLHYIDLASGTGPTSPGHGSDTEMMSFVGTTGFIVAVDHHGGARLWNPATGESRELAGTPDQQSSLSRSGELLAVTEPEQITLWSLPAATKRVLTDPGGQMRFAGFAPDGRHLLSGSQEVRIWDVASGQSVVVDPPPPLRARSFVMSSQLLAATTESGDQIQMWSLATGKPVSSLPAEHASLLAFLPDAKRLCWVSDDGSVTLGDLATGKTKVLEKLATKMRSLEVSSDGRFISVAGGRAVHLYDLVTGERRTLLHGLEVEAGLFLPGRLLSIGSDRTLRVWELGGTPRRRVVHDVPEDGFALSPDGTTVAVASNRTGDVPTPHDHDVAVVTTATGERRALPFARLVRSLAYAPDGKTLAVEDAMGAVELIDLASGAHRALTGQASFARPPLTFTPDGKRLLAAGADAGLLVWDTATGQASVLAAPPPAKPTRIGFIRVAADGQHVLAALGGGELEVWELATRQRKSFHTDAWVVDVALSPDGRLIALPKDQDVVVHDLVSGADTHLVGHTSSVAAVAFAETGLLASAGDDNEVRVWNLTSRESRVLEGHTRSVRGLAFSPDATRILTASMDGTGRLWDLASRTGRIVSEGSKTNQDFGLAFSRDGRAVAVHQPDGTLVVTLDDLPFDPAGLTARIAEATTLRIDPADVTPPDDSATH